MRPGRVSLAAALLLFLAFLWTAPPLGFFLTSADHASNIGLGALVAKGGMFPFVDHFHFYGPLAALVSAAAMTIHDSLVSEVVLCAAGYALAIGLLFRFTARHAPLPVAVAVALAAFRLSARFYKYYYWLMPALALELVDRLPGAEGRRRRALLAALGFCAAAGGLFRFDLGVALAVFGLLGIAADRLRPEAGGPRLRRDLAAWGAGYAVPWSAWLAGLALRGGAASIGDYLAATWTGTFGYVAKHAGRRVGFWRFDAADPLSVPSATSLLHVAAPLVYLACLATAVAVLRRPARRVPPSLAWALGAAGLLGLGLFPQALHTPDAHHVLHAAAPLFPALALLLTAAWRPGAGRAAGRVAVTVLAVLVAAGGWGIREVGSRDLTPLAHDVAAKYRALEAGIDAPEPGFWGEAMRRVRELSADGDRILALYNEAYFYYFTGRPMSGIFHNYTGVFAGSPDWRWRNIEALRRHPPELVVARRDVLEQPLPGNALHRGYPQYYRFVTRRYRRVLHRQGPLLILGAGE